MPVRDVQPVVEHPDLGPPGTLDQGLRAHDGGAVRRCQALDEVGAAVIDHEEVRALRIVGAARGAPFHVQVRLRHDELAGWGSSNGRSGMVRPVWPVTAISTASSSSLSGSGRSADS